MSLKRYINEESVLSLAGSRYGQLYTTVDLSVFNERILIPHDPNIVKDQINELHIYSFYGDYVTGNHNANYNVFENNTNSLLLNVGKTFKEANIQNGSYIIVNNLFKPVWGNFNTEPLLVKEISPDRTEIKFVIDQPFLSELQGFKSEIDLFKNKNILNNLVVNFGFNRIQKIINVWFDADNKTIYVKLYQPIYDDIDVLNKAFVLFEVIDPYIDSVTFSTPISLGNVNVIPKPNYYLDTAQFTGESTIFKSWDDILDSDLPTTQQIIDQTLSSSNLVRLNIDYTDFNNFVFYSSAKERIENFYYKIGKIETYSSSINLLNVSTASNTIFVSSSIALNQRRIDQITTTFDPFEKWLYYSSTSSIFTHDVTGSITPYPKRLISNKYVNHYLTSSIVQTWYDNVLSEATEYDQLNMNRLYWAIPEHIIMDDGNSDFVLFTEMLGQHYDTLYTYIKALPQIHERDEHPERGFSNDLSFYIAKGFGWNLQNSHQLSDIWKYKLGTEKDGTIIQSGSFTEVTHEGQTQQIWRRIINNLPYLLKTKGTDRSIKAMMSIYGIPQTLISIKEYGGPTIDIDKPSLVEDRYYYKANFTGSNWIELPRVSTPDTVEFRFSTNYSSSLSMSLWAIESEDRTRLNANLELCHIKTLTNNYLYSGSYQYGYLKFTITENNGGNYISSSITSDILPLYNNDFWNVNISVNADDAQYTFYNDDSELSTSGSRYYLSGNGSYGFPRGVVKSTAIPTTHYTDDLEAASSQSLIEPYYLSSDNIFGVTPYISKFITATGSILKYNTDYEAIASGLLPGQTYAVSGSNVWGLTEGIEKLILPTNSFKIQVGSAGDCSFGKLIFTSSKIWTGSYSIDDTWGTGSILIGGTTSSNSTRFIGSIGGYKEYYEILSSSIFESHTLNPMAYHGNNPTSSYDTLYRYFPLGLDCQRWDHGTYINVSSSHPNRTASEYTTASFKNWNIGDEKIQYISTNERFYITTPSLGNNTLRSNKVRIENTKLLRDLNPNTRSDISNYDNATFDTNRLAIVFSPTDQLNNDIHNHSGYFAIDDYIGDPEYEFNENYNELNRFSFNYFKKYQQNFDVNKFIRLFSIYDFTFFDQIKQLLPARADYIGGILIEDDVLHRNKLKLTNRPILTNPQYETEYNLDIFTSSAEYLTYETTASNFIDIDFTYKYLTSSLDVDSELSIQYKYLTGSIQLQTSIESVAVNYPDTSSYPNGLCAEFDIIPTRYSGSQTLTQSYVDNYKLNCCYKKVIYHYSSSGNFTTEYLRDWHTAVSKSYGWYYSRSLECTDYQYQESCATENYKRFYGSRLEGLGININSPNTVDGGPVVSIFVSNNSSLYYTDDPLNGNLKVQ